MKASERLEQIRRAHKSAEPKPAVNPAWANTHRDLGFCLSVIESQAKAIEEMRGALERIAFEGISDREKLTESAREYLEDYGGKYPNERTIAAYALYTLASHSKEGEQG